MTPAIRIFGSARLLGCALLVVAFLAPWLRAQSGTGFIQITCEPGVQVFLDGSFKGVPPPTRAA